MTEAELQRAVRHEVNNHLAAIQLNARVLTRDVVPELRRVAEDIEMLSRDAGVLLSHSQDLSREVPAGEPLDLAACMAELPRHLRAQRVEPHNLEQLPIPSGLTCLIAPEPFLRQLALLVASLTRGAALPLQLEISSHADGAVVRLRGGALAVRGGVRPRTVELMRELAVAQLERLDVVLLQSAELLTLRLPHT